MSRSEKRKKILVVIPSFDVGSGVAMHVMNYYNRIYKHFKIDFITYTAVDNINTKIIKKNGGKIFYFKKGFLNNISPVKKFFRSHADDYDIIHCHTFNYGLLYLFYAKKYGIKNRIIHMHSIKYSDNSLKAALNSFLVKRCLKYANIYTACSSNAGRRAFRDRDFFTINNGIDFSRFSNGGRKTIRKKLGLKNDEFLFGNVGRLVKTKNQLFALEIFAELKKSAQYSKAKFLLIGDGPERSKILNYVKTRNIEESVIFISGVYDTASYYAAMDCFIFPSVSEGLGMALIEAQASGLTCFCSDDLPDEVFASGIIYGLNVKSGPKVWTEAIMESDLARKNVKKDLRKAGFDINEEARKIVKFYNNSAGVEKQTHVVHVVPTLCNGGTERYLIDLIKNTSDSYKNDIITYDSENYWKKELDENKVSVVVFKKPSDSGIVKNIITLQKFFKKNKPDIVYAYTSFNSAYVLLAAFLAGVKIRIAHSHTSATEHKRTIPYAVYCWFSKILLALASTHKLACSNKAGEALFGKNYVLIRNGIDINMFKLDQKNRKKIRRELKISSKTTLIGTVGRLDKNKNQKFILDVLDEYLKNGFEAKLVIVGDGPEKVNLKKYAKEIGVEDHVIFTGSVKDVKKYYDAFDVFLLTSYNEGLPYVLIEAQANGLPILASDTIDNSAKINSNFKFLSLKLDARKWAEQIRKSFCSRTDPDREIEHFSTSEIVMEVERVYGKNE